MMPNIPPDLYSDERDHDRAERERQRQRDFAWLQTLPQPGEARRPIEQRCPACNCRKIDCDCPPVWGWYGILIALVLVAIGLGVLGGR